MAPIRTVKQRTGVRPHAALEELLYARFLYSEIAAIHGLANIPTDPQLAIAAGTRLCEELLEPLQAQFGRITIRSAYRSAEGNELSWRMQAAGKPAYSCASNERNYAHNISDVSDKDGYMGATACFVILAFIDRFRGEGDWQKRA